MQLTEDQQRYVVRLLAHFRTPFTVAREFRKEFGVEITSKQVWDYDPSKVANKGRIRAELRKLFTSERAAYLKAEKQVGASHRAYRVERLHRMSEKAEEKGNLQLAASLLEQAAKEIGGQYEKGATETAVPVEFTLNLGGLPGQKGGE